MAAELRAAQEIARRLKAEQEHELKIGLDLMKDVLKNDGWEAYQRKFLRMQTHNDWDSRLLDTTQDDNGDLTNVWNIANETAEQLQDRKNIFLILCSTAGEYDHLLNHVPNGNAQMAWQQLRNQFTGHTAADFNALSDEFNNCNQVALGLSVNKFITRISDLGTKLGAMPEITRKMLCY